ncbi:predicted protein [Nematostella vectensis]|uniref:Vasohibin-like protein n=1 Tax=Nematostella vectensis TaxID=45351 RepID=A7S7P4_NEMVE|nr:predicted protein [Nematostella vectensis]|eukprot:XP_001632293.1 predicted protein [Nematostella vectensis]
MWTHVEKIHPDGMKMVYKIREKADLEEVPYASAPVFSPSCVLTVTEKLVLIQKYLQQLQYNHTGTQLFEIKKYRPYTGLMDTAREIIKESLPIKCLEAVIVSLYLTSSMSELQRFTIGFKTQFGSSIYRHVVLGVHANGKYGALGLSRRDDLMYKPLTFKSLCDLLNDFVESYGNYLHSVKKIKLSLPIVHDLHSCEKIHWKYLALSPAKLSASDMKKILEKYSRELRTTVRDRKGRRGG